MLANETIEVTFTLYSKSGPSEITNDPILPMNSTGWRFAGWTESQFMYCTVNWVGQPNDVKASICSYSDELRQNGNGCMELN